MKGFIKFLRDEEGATAIEYALIAALIAVVIAVALSPLGTKLAAIFTDITSKLPATSSSSSSGG